MKKPTLLFCLFAAACTPRVPENEFHIEGRVAGLRDSTVIELTQWDGNTGRRIATDTVFGSIFSFVLPMTENTRLSISGRSDEFPSVLRYIYAVPGEKITITGEGALYGTWDIKSRVPEQREADRFIFNSKDEFIRMQLISIEMKKVSTELMKEYSERNRAVYDSLIGLGNDVNLKMDRNNIALMDETPFSEVWLEKLEGLSRMTSHGGNWAALKDDAVRLYERLTPEQKELPAAQTTKFALFPPEKVGVGDRMADTELKAFDGSMHRLSNYLGRYIILDFWSSGCGPCIMSMPELKRLTEKYPDNLSVLGINLDTSEEGWRKGTETFKPSYLNLNAPPSSDIDERYGVRGIPHFVIISPDGVILDSWAGYGEGLIAGRLAKHIDSME
jgi:thiol-disulfide isomerase/thioredoxin